MKQISLRIFCRIISAFFLAITPILSWSQVSTPFKLINNSANNGTYIPDSDIYIAVVGEYLSAPNVKPIHMWINPITNQSYNMEKVYNTISGPTPGPGLDYKYANCFFKLSDIPNQTFTLPPIQGCRVYISFKKPLYFYFYGSQYINDQNPGGYSAPNNLNATDPNLGTKFETIELTNDSHGFFGNPSRVDAYQYPMGLELSGSDESYTRVGDLKKHDDIVNLYKATVPKEFKSTSITANGEIFSPGKSANFQEKTDTQAAGTDVNYLQAYIDAIWNGFKTKKLTFYAGDAGVFTGQVDGSETFRLTCVTSSSGFYQQTGSITKPTTQDVFEGKNTLATGSELDKVVQAQMCAAINRHVVDYTSTAQQNWYDASQFYNTPWNCNYYAKFWHTPGLNINTLAYGFAYDDVADQSPSLHTAKPTLVTAFIGGFVGRALMPTNAPPKVTLISPKNLSTYSGPTVIELTAKASDDSSVSKVEFYSNGKLLGTDIASPYTYTWQYVPAGEQKITAKAYDNTGISATTRVTTITVDNRFTSGPIGYCMNSADFRYNAVTNADNTASFVFAPVAAAGGNLVILYLQNAMGQYDGYLMSKNTITGNFSFTSSTALANTTKLYFTYQVGSDGPQNTTYANPFTYVMGSGCATQGRSGTATPLKNVEPVNSLAGQELTLQVSPNPVRGQATVYFALPQAGEYTITLQDMNGRIVKKHSATATAGSHAVTINTATYSSGVYILRFICSSGTHTQRVVVSN